MAKYINQSQRVFVIGDKNIIPGGESVELTTDEQSHSVIAALIKDNSLVNS